VYNDAFGRHVFRYRSIRTSVVCDFCGEDIEYDHVAWAAGYTDGRVCSCSHDVTVGGHWYIVNRED